MKSVCIIRKPTLKILKEYSELFFHIVFLEICKLFELIPKGLSTKNRLCFGTPLQEFEKEWKNAINQSGGRCCDLLLQGQFKKLFRFMDIFWCDMYVEVDFVILLL